MLNSILAYGYAAFGDIFELCGDRKSAIENYSEAIKLGLQNGDAYCKRGRVKLYAKDYQGAIDDFNLAFQLEPQSVDAYAYFARGSAYAAIGENQTALEDCGRAIQLDAQFTPAYWQRSIANTHLGNYEAALEDLTFYDRHIPSDNVFINTLVHHLKPTLSLDYSIGVLQYFLDRNPQAIESLTKTLSSNSNLAVAYYFRGHAYYNLGEEQRGREDFEKAALIESDDENSFYKNFLLSLVESKDKIEPDDEHGFYARGLARFRMENREGAIADLQKAAEIAAKHKYATLEQKVTELLQQIQA